MKPSMIIFLSKKAIVIIGVAGACRRDELCKIVLDDVDIRDDITVISIPNSKNRSPRRFVITEPQLINIVKKYLANWPTDTGADPGFLLHWSFFTAPASSATLLAENGGDLLSLKRHGGWKSATVAEGYIEELIADKKRIAKLVQKPNILSNENLIIIPSTSFTRQVWQKTYRTKI
ncbi:hypothetical protein NQ317_000360 [Molorchus minor]|uniref:Tyr recombinase domain-containing protein n=1 Tax=Molorchus minor TaxID=1323400 RepID=A0ABQ9JNJ0_9CUCU|nr:hypothetical protein NQ317_000360 [Molorchus minor]